MRTTDSQRARSARARVALAAWLLLASATGLGCSSKLYWHAALAPEGGEAATLVLIRQQAMQMGSALSVYLNRERVARLAQGSYAEIRVKPGRYDIQANTKIGRTPGAESGESWMAGIRELEVEAGGTYYVLMEISSVSFFGLDPIWSCSLIGEGGARSRMAEYERVAP